MAYQSIFTPNSQRNFSQDFKPGQYAKVNAAIAKRNPQNSLLNAPTQQKSNNNSLFSKIKRVAFNVGRDVGQGAEKAGKAVARPVADVVTGKGGKAVHDTAQLANDVTGGSAGYFAENDLINPAKQLIAQATKNRKAYVAANQKKNIDLGLGKKGTDLKGGALKLAGNAANALLLPVGGGELGAAKKLAQAGGKTTAKELAAHTIDDATLGAVGGASNTLAQNPHASMKDVFKNAAVGAGIGGAVPVAAHGAGLAAKKIFSKGADTALSELKNSGEMKDIMTPEQADKAAAAAHTKITPQDQSAGAEAVGVRTPIHAGIKQQSATYNIGVRASQHMTDEQYAKEFNRLSNAYDKEINNIHKGVSVTEINPESEANAAAKGAKPQLPPIDGYHSTKELVNDTASVLKSMDEGAHGGQMIPDGEGGYKRITEHTPFYSNYFAENGHAPSVAAYREEAQKQLESGKAPYREMNDTYQKLKGREANPNSYNPKNDTTSARAFKTQLTTKQHVMVRQIDAKYEKAINDLNDRYKNGTMPDKTTVKRVASETSPAEKPTGGAPKEGINVRSDAYKVGARSRITKEEATAKLQSAGYKPEETKTILQDALPEKGLSMPGSPKKIGLNDESVQKSAANFDKAQEPKEAPAVIEPSTPVSEKPTPAPSSVTEAPAKPTESSNLRPLQATETSAQGTSKLGSSVREKALQEKITSKTEAEAQDLPAYNKANMKEQAQFATELVKSNPQKAIDIAMGKTEAPAHILPQMVYNAVEEYAKGVGGEDGAKLLLDLSRSKQVTNLTTMAQNVRAAAERDPNSPTNLINQVAASRAQKIKGGAKSVTAAIKADAKEVAKVTPKIKPDEWKSFVDGLRC